MADIPDFTPKDWRDFPSRDTPISAAALEDQETRVSTYARSVGEAVEDTLETALLTVVSEARTGTSVGRDGAGRVTSQTVDGAVTTFTRDPATGFVTAIHRPDGKVETFTRDGSGRVTGSVVA